MPLALAEEEAQARAMLRACVQSLSSTSNSIPMRIPFFHAALAAIAEVRKTGLIHEVVDRYERALYERFAPAQHIQLVDKGVTVRHPSCPESV